MLSFQWILVGMFEEPLARALVQTYLMNRLRGTVKVLRWDFHIGTIIAGILFGIGHVVPHFFFGGPWISVGPHLVFAALFGLLAGYIYQETRSLAGPIVMHNVVDGLLHTVALLY
jgi:membrane protease YdiL (CAAX protease family)